jgi:hypothetical protein
VTIASGGVSVKDAEVMFLTAPNGDAAATNGITLGGAFITNSAPWQGRWLTLHSAANSRCEVIVPPASAAVVRIGFSRRRAAFGLH